MNLLISLRNAIGGDEINEKIMIIVMILTIITMMIKMLA